jgi:hypothetical protein
MIWLTWRQHRKQLLFTAAALAALAALMIPTGLAMRHAFDQLGLANCQSSDTDACRSAFNQFNNEFRGFTPIPILFLLLPVLIGLFWGAPLVARELEHGTHRLVWTQGISRQRWALVKVGFAAGATAIAAVIFGLGMTWWSTPLAHAGDVGRFDVFFFDMQGVAPIGYTLFAVALGIFAGTILPRMLPAMGVTLVSVLAVRILVDIFARPHYLPPRTLTFAVVGGTEPNPNAGDWIISTGVRGASGQMVAPNAEILCPPNATGPGGGGCGADLGIGPGAYNWELYQPADRYWLFQGIETGLYVVLAGLLIYLAVRRVRRLA